MGESRCRSIIRTGSWSRSRSRSKSKIRSRSRSESRSRSRSRSIFNSNILRLPRYKEKKTRQRWACILYSRQLKRKLHFT